MCLIIIETSQYFRHFSLEYFVNEFIRSNQTSRSKRNSGDNRGERSRRWISLSRLNVICNCPVLCCCTLSPQVRTLRKRDFHSTESSVVNRFVSDQKLHITKKPLYAVAQEQLHAKTCSNHFLIEVDFSSENLYSKIQYNR